MCLASIAEVLPCIFALDQGPQVLNQQKVSMTASQLENSAKAASMFLPSQAFLMSVLLDSDRDKHNSFFFFFLITGYHSSFQAPTILKVIKP